MVAALRWSLAVAVALSGAALVAPSAEPADKKAAPAKPLDLLKLPADAVIVIVDKIGDELKLLPRSVQMSPEEYQKILDELKQLREKAPKEVTSRPSKLHLRGRVEGNIVFLKAQFDFATDKPRTTVSLGCKPAQATNHQLRREGADPLAKLGPFADLRTDPDGFDLYLNQAEPKGCQLTLDLVLGLTAQGNARSFELKLPQAAVTTLDFSLPTGARDVRLGDQMLTGATSPFLRGERIQGALGDVPKLSLNWKQGKVNSTGPKLLDAEGTIHVHLDEQRAVHTEARLLLRVQGGLTDSWELIVPPGAELKLSAADVLRGVTVAPIAPNAPSLRTIRLKEPSADPLLVTVVVAPRTPESRNPGRVPVGPFIVRGVQSQKGSIFVTGKTPEPRLHEHGDTRLRDATREEKDAYPAPFLRVFSYDNIPQPIKLLTAAELASFVLLEVEPNVRGAVRTRTTHTVRMELDPVTNHRQWFVFTRIEGELVSQGTVDQLEVLLPMGSTFVPPENSLPAPLTSVKAEGTKGMSPPATGASTVGFLSILQGPTLAAATQLARTQVILKQSDDPWKKFDVTLPVVYPVVVGEKGEAIFELPRVLEPAAGSRTELNVVVPRDVELTIPERPSAAALTAVSPHKLAWRPEPDSLNSERTPAEIDVVWRPYRPEVRAIADVTLTTPERKAQVHHELYYRYPPSPKEAEPPGKESDAQQPPVTLQLPSGVQSGTFEVVSGGELLPEDARNPQKRRVRLKATAAGKEALLELRYSFLLHAEQAKRETYPVPLVVPEEVTRGETRVRVWSEPGTLPEPEGPETEWSRLNIEKVRGKPLPVLVLKAQRVDLPLALRLAAVGGERVTVLADRALIRVEVTENQGHRYRASFLLTQLLTRHLDIKLPAPVPSLGLEVTLAGERVTPEVVDEKGERSDSGRVARLRLGPELVQRSVLEVSYLVPPGRVKGGVFQTELQPPVLDGEPGRVLTRWQVTLPSGWVPLGPEGGAGTPRVWSRSGWLLVPRLGVSADEMDRWFKGNENVPHALAADSAQNPHLICLRSGLEPITVLHAPFKPWLGCCSLAVLLVGLGLYFLARRAGRGSPVWFWVSLALLTFGLGAFSLFRPTALTALAYGAELGGAVLLIFAGLLWLMHERQRRQIVFLPSFRRGRGGSSLVRAGSGVGPGPNGSGTGPKPQPLPQPGEPSTVDAPRPAASNHG